MKNIIIIGCTGSIGTQTLDVIKKQPQDFKLVGISANQNYEKMIEIIREFKPMYVVMTDKAAYEKVSDYCLGNKLSTEVYTGMDNLVKISTLKEVDIVVTSVVGMVGLVPTLSAIKAGKDIALANKETLVVAGEIVMKAAKENNIHILPVDSEHGAIYQCLQGNKWNDLKKIHLTASGGPFRGRKREELLKVTSLEALKHPKWNMGKKISIDSSTLMNKGLEVIEAHWLFDCAYDDIEVIIHPQSIIHSMVEYKDGSIVAQLGVPDMRLPIQYALSYPKRNEQIVDTLNFKEIKKLTFEEPDMESFPCLKLAYSAGRQGKLMPTILNGANEACVELFLNNRITFYEISDIIEDCMLKFDYNQQLNVENIIDMDRRVKEYINSKYY